MADQIKKKVSLRDVLEMNTGKTTVPGVHALKDQKNAALNYGSSNYIADNPKVTTNLQTLYQNAQTQKKQQTPAQSTVRPATGGSGSGNAGTGAAAAPATQGQTLADALAALKNAQSALEKAEGARPGDYTQSDALLQLQGSLNTLEGQRPQGYTPDQAVMDAQKALADLQKPEDYQSRYDAQINGILQTIAGAKDFTYEAAEDPMYKVYRDQYLRMGQRAAEDAMANAAALTGGYGSSYGQMAANQANQNYIAELNNQVPTLMQMAYQRHQDQIADQYNQLSAYQSAENMDYGKWRDLMGDYQTDRDYLAGRYDTEFGKDYQEYRDLVGDYESELAYMYGKYSDMSADEYQKYMNNMDLWLQDRDYYLQKHGLAQEQANYMQEWDYQTNGKSGGSGGGGSGSGSSSGGTAGEKSGYTQTYRSTYQPRTQAAALATPGQIVPGVHVVKNQTNAQQDYGLPNALVADGKALTLKELAQLRSTQSQMTEAEKEALMKKYGTYYRQY